MLTVVQVVRLVKIKFLSSKIMIPKQVFVIAQKVFIKILRIFYVNLVILLAKLVKDLA